METCRPFDDDLGWLVQQVILDDVQEAEPSSDVWRRIRQEVRNSSRPGAARRACGFWRRWQLKCDAAHTALEAATTRRYGERRQHFYFVGIPFLLVPQPVLLTASD